MAEFSIDFRVKAAASGWGESALKSAYFHSLNESIKDELATLDEPSTLEELIKLKIRLDNRLRARSKSRPKSRFLPVSVLPEKSNDVSPSTVPSGPQPMQIGHTRLTSEERQRRFKLNLCMYCGEPGHFVSTCPAKVKAGVRQRK